MSAISTNLGSSFMKFTFTDEDGETVASFRLNPADVKLAQRAEEVSEYFKKVAENAPEEATLEIACELNKEVEEKVCYLLGYDVRQSLFGLFSATSIMEDGSMFVSVVMEKIVSAISPEIEKRQKAMDKAVNKHTAKYR